MIEISTTLTQTGTLLSPEALRQKIMTAIHNACERGIGVAEMGYAAKPYTAATDDYINITVEDDTDGSTLKASGPSVIFREFGSGVVGGGHPRGADLGFTPGSWSEGPYGKGHWTAPGGWWLPRYKTGGRGVRDPGGNPPARAMYDAAKTIEAELRRELGGG